MCMTTGFHTFPESLGDCPISFHNPHLLWNVYTYLWRQSASELQPLSKLVKNLASMVLLWGHHIVFFNTWLSLLPSSHVFIHGKSGHWTAECLNIAYASPCSLTKAGLVKINLIKLCSLLNQGFHLTLSSMWSVWKKNHMVRSIWKTTTKREALKVIKMHINETFWQGQSRPLAYLGCLPSIGIFPFAFSGHWFSP